MTPGIASKPPRLQVAKVLFPTDFSPCAHQAFAHATSLAGRFGADLHVLHAIPPPWYGVYDPMGYAAPSEEAHATARRIADDRLKEVAGHPLTSGLHVVTTLSEDYPPAPGILDYAERHGADLIVMGTHGRRGPARLLLGSTAEEVVRHSACPVLTVREPQNGETAARLLPRLVLVPFDFSTPSRFALADAAEVARSCDAHLLVLYVIEERPSTPEIPVIAGLAAPGGLERRISTIRLRLRDLLDYLAEGVPGEVEVRVGRPATEILSVAARPDVDLVVMATHGLTGIRRLLFGSNAEEVLRLVTTPLLLVKAPVAVEEEQRTTAATAEEAVPAATGPP
jgi:nucleotide-binding universal stress UspA family protein